MSNKQTDLIKNIKQMQKELDKRTDIENKAFELITQGKNEEANELLKTI